jgi:16S rRNA processing protein RimM
VSTTGPGRRRSAAPCWSWTPVGTVTDVVHSAATDLLVLRDAEDKEHLIPFVREMVPTVDVPGGRVVVDPPEGLFDL